MFDPALHEAYTAQLRMKQRWQDAEVILLRGKYKGRSARIESVMADLTKYTGPRWLYLAYVQRKDGKGDLNTDPASRSYIPRGHFETAEDRRGGSDE